MSKTEFLELPDIKKHFAYHVITDVIYEDGSGYKFIVTTAGDKRHFVWVNSKGAIITII